MSNINKQALREAAGKATGAHDRLSVMPADDIFDISQHEGTQLDADITALNAFNEVSNPATVLALLDELKRKDKEKSELKSYYEGVIADGSKRIAELEAISSAAEKLVRCKGRYHSEQNYRALAALFGVTTPDLPPLESEARAVTVKLPERKGDSDGSSTSKFDYGWNAAAEYRDEQWKTALTKAGINLTVEG